jgi:hypothetical protein
MSPHHDFSGKHYWLSRFSAAPLELKLFYLFSFLVSLLSIGAILLPHDFSEAIIPVTGWLPATIYIIALIVATPLIFRGSNIRLKKIHRLGVLGLLILSVIRGLVEMKYYNNTYVDNPYLFISQWRPVWTIVIPLIWMVLLSSNSITIFCNKEEQFKPQASPMVPDTLV